MFKELKWMKLSVGISILFAGIGIIVTNSDALPDTSTTFRYVITETGKFSSLDPLDADTTRNLPVARMLYATPLETSDKSQLTSRVLESFRYDRANRTIEWIVRDGIKYEDGFPITADDVAFAVARMAYTRPKFPVLSAIEGVDSWSKTESGLTTFPKGLKVEGRKITIQLTEDIEHPLFRFCLELFSVIPRRCVDTSTNKISCNVVPESGPYKMVSQTPETITFQRRVLEPEPGLPSTIQFVYTPAADMTKGLDTIGDDTVVAGSEADFSPDAIRKIESSLKLQFMPASRFEALLINKNVPPFSDQKCRWLFARTFRTVFHRLAQDRHAEGSIFTKILPGYGTLEHLNAATQISANDVANCKAALERSEIPWGFDEADRNSLFVRTVETTLRELGVKKTLPVAKKSRKEFAEAFTDGNIAFFNAGSGFWALDPAGDTRMLFTPNLHKPLAQITSDQHFQQLLHKLDREPDSFKKLNEYMFEESLINVYGHQRRFFAAKNKSLAREVTFAITSPAPWQVFTAK